MARSHGWSVLAEKALELAALALSVRAMERPLPTRHGALVEPRGEPVEPLRQAQDDEIGGIDAIAAAADPLAFIKETTAPGTRCYRASDDRGEVYAAFYEDGRVRIAGGERRYAGVVEAGHADLLDVENNGWSELFVRTTPEGRVQLELRGGEDDARILNCDAIE